MIISKQLSKELNIKPQQSEAVIKLIDDGNTIPFIARYRKEATGSLDDTVLRKFNERLNYLRNLESRKETIIESIKEQGKLTSTLKDSINKALTLVELEDLYLPYKKKRATRASKARDKGLGPLSEIILDQDIKEPVENIAKDFLNDKVKTIKDAIKGAMDIIAEDIAENAKFRKRIRDDTYKNGDISIKAKDENVESEYEMYYDYDESIYDITPHRILAINRGEKEGILKIKIDTDDDEIKQYIANHTIKPNKYTDEIIEDSIDDSYKRLIKPAIERDIRSILKEEAEDKSI